MIKERIRKIRELMIEDGVTYYLVDTNDPHLSEYINDHYKEREYLSGFTGSNGTLLISLNSAYLWTDGRYFVQAENELKGSDITLMKSGQKGVPTLIEFIKENVTSDDVFAFNGFLISAKMGLLIEDILFDKNASIESDVDYCAKIWTDRPSDSAEQISALNYSETGKNVSEKLSEVRSKIKEHNCNFHFISKLDDIMWLYNIRGDEIDCNPVCYSYTMITKDRAIIYLKDNSIRASHLADLNRCMEGMVEIRSYKEVSEVFDFVDSNDNILLDKNTSNYNIYKGFKRKCNVIEADNPTELLKAVKNEIEISNSKKCYLEDSVCLTKFLMWLKEEVKHSEVSESKAAMILDGARSRIVGFMELSFPTISAYGANAAMMHYEAIQGKDAILKPEGLYLVDSGATYHSGTTDVTRTIALGPVTDEMKKHFTLALAGMLRLQNAVFIKGATGRNLDILARGPLWEHGIDYKCGTGHGVGYMLNVHEGPHSIRTLRRKGEEETEFQKGMIVSDEPGVYIPGCYGIRIENILLCDDYMSTDDGDFLCFKPLTLVPIDLDCVDVKFMNDNDIKLLNDYHQLVFESLKDFMNEDELKKLAEMTKKI